jgi:streptogramin lyase
VLGYRSNRRVLVALALCAFGAGIAGCGGGSSGGATSLRIAWTAHVKAHIDQVAVGEGGVWLTTDGGVVRLDPSTGKIVASIPVAGISGVIATGAGSVWAAFLAKDKLSSFLLRIDPSQNRVVDQTPRFQSEALGIAVGAGGLWVTTDLNGGEINEFDPTTVRMVGSPIMLQPAGQLGPTQQAAGGAVLEGTTLWVPQGMSGTLTRVDTTSRSVVGSPVQVGGENVGPVVPYGGAIWVGSDANNIVSGSGQVVQVQGGSVSKRVTVPGETTIQGLTSAFGEVWVLGLDGNGKLQALDPASGQLTGRPTIFQAGQAVTAVSGLGAVWVFTTDNQLYKLVGA